MGNCFQAENAPKDDEDSARGNLIPKTEQDFQKITVKLNDAQHDHEQTKKTCVNLGHENAQLKEQIKQLKIEYSCGDGESESFKSDSILLLSSLTVYIDKILGRPGSQPQVSSTDELMSMIKKQLDEFEPADHDNSNRKMLEHQNMTIEMSLRDERSKIECLAREKQSVEAQVVNLELLLETKTREYEEARKKAEWGAQIHLEHEEMSRKFKTLQSESQRSNESLDRHSEELNNFKLEKQSLVEQLTHKTNELQETAQKLFAVSLERDNAVLLHTNNSETHKNALAERAEMAQQFEKMKSDVENGNLSAQLSLRDEQSKTECLTREKQSIQTQVDNLKLLLETKTREHEEARKNAELGDQARTQFDELSKQFKVLEEIHKDAKTQIERHGQEQSDKSIEQRNLSDSLASKSNELSETVQKLLATSQERDSAIMQAKGDAETLKTTLAAKLLLEQQIEKLKNQAVPQEKTETLQKERDEANVAKETLQTALSKMGQDLAMERIRLEEVENEKDVASIEKDSLQNKIDAMGEERNAATQAAEEERDHAIQERNSLEHEIEELTTVIAEQTENINEKEQLISEKTKDLDSAKQLIEMIEMSSKANESAINELKSQLEEKSTKLDECMDANAKLLTDQIDQKVSMENQILELKGQAAVEHENNADSAWLKEEIEKLKSQNSEQAEYISDLESMEDFRSKYEELERSFSQTETENQSLKQQLSSLGTKTEEDSQLRI